MAINYSKVGWNTNSYVNPVNMNQMDDGIKSACDAIDDLGDDLDKFIRAEDELGTETTETRDADILGGQYTASNITTMQNSINTLNNNLAQTNAKLNELNKTNANTSVDLTGKIGIENRYTFESDGYLSISSKSLSSGNCQCRLYGSNDRSIANYFVYFSHTWELYTTYVKKGMKMQLDNISSGAECYFIPFTD